MLKVAVLKETAEDIITSALKTKAAVKRYNELAQEDKPVGGLFHSTC